MKRANHERLLTYRSVVIAHANDEKHEVTLIQKGTVIDWDNGKGKGTLTEHSEMIRGPELARGTIRLVWNAGVVLKWLLLSIRCCQIRCRTRGLCPLVYPPGFSAFLPGLVGL